MAASETEDHQHADTFGWHRSWQNDIPPGSTWRGRQGAGEEEVTTGNELPLKMKPTKYSDGADGRCLDRERLQSGSVVVPRGAMPIIGSQSTETLALKTVISRIVTTGAAMALELSITYPRMCRNLNDQ